jgi:acetylornithine deacetylase/succinyl-diaminopimelate desuccinylase-like protein
MDTIRRYIHANRERFLEELKAFVRFPSISAQPAHADDLKRCAEWLANHLRAVGLQRVEVVPTSRHPLVYAEWRGAPGRPTLLIYGHYDVQPVDPLSAWHSPPFQPRLADHYLYGRGASDDKGQLFAHVKAIECYLRAAGRLPINVVCLFEGEEEIGSGSLLALLERQSGQPSVDAAVISDMAILSPQQPAITYALRGSLSMELTVRGPARDLHSGTFGGVVHNPLEALARAIARLHDSRGRVAIPGFYETVRTWSDAERAAMARAGRTDARILRDAGVARGWGEPGYSLYERATIRPALTINGISGGYSGPGGKAIIPAQASAKISFRLVPDQNPADIESLLCRYLRRIIPPTAQWSAQTYFRSPPLLVNRRHPAILAAAEAYRQGFGASPVFLRSGGSIPVAAALHNRLGLPTALMGFALPDDRAHGPNERFYLPNFFNGIRTSAAFLQALAAALVG